MREWSAAAEAEEEARSSDGGEHCVLGEQEPWAAGEHGHRGAEHEQDHDSQGQASIRRCLIAWTIPLPAGATVPAIREGTIPTPADRRP
jgi:hypothetical protein